MVDAKVTVNLKGMKALAVYAKQGGTEHAWMDMAIEYMERANEEIDRLELLLVKERGDE